MFTDNKYYQFYQRLCARAKTREVSEYTEKHHIIPRSLGGQNTKDNLVRLLPREHYVAHLCLVRCTKGNAHFKMVCAAKYLVEGYLGKELPVRLNSRQIAKVREAHAEAMRIKMQGNTYGRLQKPKPPMSAEDRQAMSERKKKEMEDPERRQRHIDAMRQAVLNPEWKRKNKLVNVGRKWTDEHRANFVASMTGLPRKPYKKTIVTCHPDRPHGGRGLCKPCYLAQYNQTVRKARLKEQRLHPEG